MPSAVIYLVINSRFTAVARTLAPCGSFVGVADLRRTEIVEIRTPLVRIRGYGIIKTALSCHTAGNRIWHNGVAPPTPPLSFSANLAADGRAQCCNVVALTGVWRVVSGERRYLYEAIRRDDTDMSHDIAAATANIETHATENKQRNFIHLYYRSALTV